MKDAREKLYITFHSEDDIIRFVNTCRRYDDAIDVTSDRMTTDAKSMLGMLLNRTGEPVGIDYRCYDDENNYRQFREEIMGSFDVKAEGRAGTKAVK